MNTVINSLGMQDPHHNQIQSNANEFVICADAEDQVIVPLGDAVL